MGVKSVSRDSSRDKENWDKIFKTLVKILQTKQEHVDSLLKDRKIIEDRLKSKHENWISDIRNYEEQLSLINNEMETMKMMQIVETYKSSLLSGLKEGNHSLCKLKLDIAETTLDELNDFKAWFDFLTVNTNENGNNPEAEIRRLKLEYEKLISENKYEVSNLLRENGFAWKQFKCIESGFTDKLKKKDEEISQANTKVVSLLSYQEELQSSNHEKDEIISTLNAKVTEMETDSMKKDDEILRLSRELESLKKSASLTPILTRCTTSTETDTKRKRGNKTAPLPKLFTSTFRVPKLKSPSSSKAI